MRIEQCCNIKDFRLAARRRLPGPIFHYIDGAADDEVTYRRNTEAYERCDLVPNVLAGVETIDMSTTVMGQKLDMPLFCSPTALQRLFHHDGERAVAKAAEKFGTMFGISSLGTVSVEEIGSTISTPKLFQLYFHKDRGLTNSMIERCIAANFDVLALTVDTITGGNRERDLRTGFTSPPRLTLKSLAQFCPASEVGCQLFHAREVRAAPTEGLRERGLERLGIRRRLFQHDARPIDELARRRECSQEMGQTVLPQGHHERCRRKACRRHWRDRHHSIQSWRASARRVEKPVRSAR